MDHRLTQTRHSCVRALKTRLGCTTMSLVVVLDSISSVCLLNCAFEYFIMLSALHLIALSHSASSTTMMKHFDRTIINVILPREEGFREGIGQGISWGTEIMTRLLRVSRHVHDEAEEALYKEFMFPFDLSRAGRHHQSFHCVPGSKSCALHPPHIYTNHPGHWRQYFEIR